MGDHYSPRRPLVLLVEDDWLLSDYLADCLEAAGYRVGRAANGLEGWCAYELEAPDLVVLDLDMPVISGFRLLRLLRTGSEQGGAPVPVIITSGYDLQEAHELVVTTRPEAYLQKPLCTARLVECVGELLRRTALPPRPATAH
jgi:DNA-binding response OmpR family regulator